MTPSTDDLNQIVHLIWSTQLGLEPRPAAPGGEPDLGARKDAMTGVVQISGGFAGALHLRCAHQLVVTAASKMFDLPGEDISADDLRDALGELTNMTAGNLKSRLPGASTISLPTVVEGTDYAITRLESEVVAVSRLELDRLPMLVTLYANRLQRGGVATRNGFTDG